MPRVLVVGSGASGVHFALTALAKGYEVLMIDVGHRRPEPTLPEATFNGLKDGLQDPSAYFLGERFEALVLPDHEREYYGFLPPTQYVFDVPPGFRVNAGGFAPLFSFAQGGLAEAWTAGCYPFNDADLAAFPFSYADLEPHYAEVARRIGITGEPDDLSRFMPVHAHLLPALRLDPHSETLLAVYRRKRRRVNRLRCYLGRTRVATLTRDYDGRQACRYLGRCLAGCPIGALYTPSLTLETCLRHPRFTYLPGLRARYFRAEPSGRVTTLVASPVQGGPDRTFPVEWLVLAAGALSSSEIFLRSVLEHTGRRIRLTGLMDNRQVLIPFVNLHMLGRRFAPENYQYHLLGLGLESRRPEEYVHGQITTLKTGLLHPIVQRLPFNLATAVWMTRALHGALGLVNLNFHDTRREENHLTLVDDAGAPCLSIEYVPPVGERARIEDALRRVRRALRQLGCIIPPGMVRVRPMGASVHYAGTLPMSREGGAYTTTPDCQSRDFPNLFLVDGATFPFLPAKNITFTLMANAVRVAHAAF